MGNRAVITTADKELDVYLHWNGGRDSVEAFLKYCELQEFRTPESDDYGWARLCQVVANFFNPGGTSIGLNQYDRLDTNNWDNGVYVIKDWKIVGRENFSGKEQAEYDLYEMLKEIDSAQPSNMQLGEKIDKAMAKEVEKDAKNEKVSSLSSEAKDARDASTKLAVDTTEKSQLQER